MASLPLLMLAIILVSLFTVSQVTATTCSDFGESQACDDNCNELGECSSVGIFTSYQNCQENGKICYNKTCTDVPTGECLYCGDEAREKMQCTNGYKGYVPSLIDCSTYYNCDLPDGSEAEPCKCAGSSFNPITRSCGGPLPSGRCTNFTPTECTAGLRGTPDSTDTLGFICIGSGSNAIVQWRVCDPGYHFSRTTGTCVYTGGSASSLCPTSTPGTFPSGSSCSYIKCYGKNDFELKNCLNGYHYSQADGGCIPGGCS